MPTLDDYLDEHPEARPKKARHFEEHDLQIKLTVFAREYVLTPHEFAAHDRTQNHGTMQHLWESKRGIRKAWPDTEMALLGGRTWRCELKRLGKRPNEDQAALADKLTALGHLTDWADCAVMWLAKARAAGIQFRSGADARAATIDALLAAARAPQSPKKARPGKPRQARRSVTQMGKIAAMQRRFGV